MKRFIFKSKSMKMKMVLYLGPVFIVLASAFNYAVFRYYSHQFKQTLKAEQYQLVSRMAAEVDDKLAHARDSLVSQAKVVPRSVIHDPAAAERYLASLPAMQMIFDNNFILFDSKGRLIAETARTPSRTGMDFSYRDYYRKTIATGKPYISPPFFSSLKHRHPVLILTAPITDESGKIVAILGGSLDLLRDNFLGNLARAKVGKGGYFYLFGTDRKMILHPDPGRIMKSAVPAVGINRVFDEAIKGFEGAEEATTSGGEQVLAAFKRLKTVDWILAANYPLVDVYAPVSRMEEIGWWIVGLGGVFNIVMVVLVTGRIAEPLLDLKQQVVASRRMKRTAPIAVDTDDEIHDLAVEFNALVEDLRIREEKLHNTSELFQLISDSSYSWVFWKNPSGEDLYVSPAAEWITGYSRAELTAMPKGLEEIIHPDDRAAWTNHVHDASNGSVEPLELRIITRTGEERWIRHSCRPIRDDDGAVIGIRGSNTDITERKQYEHQLQHISVHDALTGLYNRMYFEAELKRLGRGRRFPVGIIVGDLDDLKKVNDSMGHSSGDEMIRTAARLLGEAFRGDDSVCRIGGDEFAALLPGADEEAVAAAISRVRSLMAGAGVEGGAPPGISLGGASARSAEELEGALALADRLMYADKRDRKSTTVGEKSAAVQRGPWGKSVEDISRSVEQVEAKTLTLTKVREPEPEFSRIGKRT